MKNKTKSARETRLDAYAGFVALRSHSETVWEKWQCGGGARWTSVHNSPPVENLRGTICNFSGCNCGTKVTHQGYAFTVEDASNWFYRPVKQK
jgi:hypothetical protein